MILADEAATARLGRAIAAGLRAGEAVCLSGPLGAGKSTLARALVRALTTPDEEVPSPTFTLVQTYDSPSGPVHHFDLWRLDGPRGLEELGWDDMAHEIVLVEWPDRLGPLKPQDALTILLDHTSHEARVATLTGWPGRLS